MLLADAAQAAEGKLYILGGGWSLTGPQPTPGAIAIKFEVPWAEANRVHVWELSVLDQDGQPVMVQTPEGERPIQIGGQFEVGRPPGLAQGTPLDLPLVISYGPLALPPGGRYVWRLSIDGRSDEDWQIAFATRSLEA
ncbi:MAG: DUF6941 family protein [Actinomycetota bacterium]